MAYRKNVDCTRRIQFCAGHRVLGHENKCGHLHGHNYVVEFTAQSKASYDGLDALGRVIDFSVLKERLGGWIDKNWDHGFLVFDQDTVLLLFLDEFGDSRHAEGAKDGQKIFVLPCNPTAENIAEYLLTHVGPTVLADTGVMLTRVVVHETENCSAEASILRI